MKYCTLWCVKTSHMTCNVQSLFFILDYLSMVLWNLFMTWTPGADVINKIYSSVATQRWNKALWLVVPSHMTTFNQSALFPYAIKNCLWLGPLVKLPDKLLILIFIYVGNSVSKSWCIDGGESTATRRIHSLFFLENFF